MARLIDWGLLLLALTTVRARVTPVVPLLWLPIEALLLSTWGFTPGKWLLRIAVRDPQGRRLTFRTAVRRSAVVWAYGLGGDSPFGLATAVFSYAGLKRSGTTYWDILGGHTVHHGRVHAARKAIAILALIGLVVAIGFASPR